MRPGAQPHRAPWHLHEEMRVSTQRTGPNRQMAHPTETTGDSPIRTFDDLLAHFHASIRPRSERRIGAEMEKFGVYTETAAPVPYAGDRGILRVLETLERDYGWKADRETPGGPLIALLRNGASITLEPAAQLELSGAPLVTIHETDAEFRGHMSELAPISKELGITWLGLGFHPFGTRAALEPMVPKQRYAIMREYLPTRGGHALDMMLRTCTVQANYDYQSEADAVRKLRIALKLSPLTTAILANSPWKEGAPAGGVTYRGRVWLDVDPDRSGLVPSMWEEKATFATYVEWALDVPMFLFKRDGHKVLNTGQTFRSFWKNGFEGHHPTQTDWQMHLNTLFPEVRLKKTLEIRGADAQRMDNSCALPALWTGIYYDDRALSEAEALVAEWRYDEVAATREVLWKDGLRAPFRGAPLADLAQRLIEIAEGGLERRAFTRPSDGKDERVHLAHLKALVAKGWTPADEVLARVKAGPTFARDVVAATDLSKG
jgi:glutamate--cysteine ligase